jgi:Family of unknown function (DUF6496)
MPTLKRSAPKKKKKAMMKRRMHDFKIGEMHSGKKSGPVVTNPKQAIAIALSQSGQSKKRKKKR